MKRKVEDIDFSLLEECCSKLGIELVPATSSDCVTLIDEQGNKVKVTTSDNMFEYDFKE